MILKIDLKEAWGCITLKIGLGTHFLECLDRQNWWKISKGNLGIAKIKHAISHEPLLILTETKYGSVILLHERE